LCLFCAACLIPMLGRALFTPSSSL
jgi:hypothetical protein